MDPTRFDRLSRTLAARGPRRGVLGLLAALPLAGALSGFLGSEGADGQGNLAGVGGGRRRRRRGRHHPGQDKKNRKGKHNKKKCTPESVAQTCANTCGSVTNNCRQPVDCGSCTCIPLTACPAGKECGTISDGCGGTVRCPFICINPTPICTANVCGACTRNDQCASDESCCAGACRNLHTDSQHCGACGTICGSGTTCVSSACKTSCPGPADCFTNPSGCICIGSESGELVCIATDYQPSACTTDLECEQAFGPGRFCAVDVGSNPVCQVNTGNKCVG